MQKGSEGMANMVSEVTIKRWISIGGGRMVHCEALDINDPNHIYNQIKSQGARPEDFGYQHPYDSEFSEKSREELIEQIVELRREITAMHKSGLF